MTYCFICNRALPAAEMVYCTDCSLWIYEDLEGPATLPRKITEAPLTFSGPSASERRPKNKGRYGVVTVGILIGFSLCSALVALCFALLDPSPQLDVPSASSRPANDRILEACALGQPGAKIERPVAKMNPERPVELKPEVQKVPNAVLIGQKKERIMRKRIEIEGGVERCYAIPGGLETTC